jgi:hypothetical protein
VPELRIDGNGHHGCGALRRQLLALHVLRRCVERVAKASESSRRASVAMTTPEVVRELRELIAALDRRMPQIERFGEESIAREADALRLRALKRIEELEREPARTEGR